MSDLLPTSTSQSRAGDAVRSIVVEREIGIAASRPIVWECLLEEMVNLNEPGGSSLSFKFEPFPGGRWYRDLGEDRGHLWAHVQVIKPPALLELTGPLFMSMPALSHVQYRLTESGPAATRLKLTHQAIGPIPDDTVAGMDHGWGQQLESIAKLAARRADGA